MFSHSELKRKANLLLWILPPLDHIVFCWNLLKCNMGVFFNHHIQFLEAGQAAFLWYLHHFATVLSSKWRWSVWDKSDILLSPFYCRTDISSSFCFGVNKPVSWMLHKWVDEGVWTLGTGGSGLMTDVMRSRSVHCGLEVNRVESRLWWRQAVSTEVTADRRGEESCSEPPPPVLYTVSKETTE